MGLYYRINIERARVQILKNFKNYEKFNVPEKKKKIQTNFTLNEFDKVIRVKYVTCAAFSVFFADSCNTKRFT